MLTLPNKGERERLAEKKAEECWHGTDAEAVNATGCDQLAGLGRD